MTSDIQHDNDGRDLSHSEHEKRRLEREAAKLFMKRYEQETSRPIRHIWHNEPAKPDISCYLDKEQLDLEIAHLYASADEARYIRSPCNKDRLWQYLEEQSSLEPEEKLDSALLRLLNNKALKHYDSDRVWLVIRNASALWNREQILRAQQHFCQSNHPFEQIWIIPDFSGQEPLIRVA